MVPLPRVIATLARLLNVGLSSNTYENTRRTIRNVSSFPYTGIAACCRMLYGRKSSNPKM